MSEAVETTTTETEELEVSTIEDESINHDDELGELDEAPSEVATLAGGEAQPDATVVFATFETPLARLTKFTYNAKNHAHQVVLEIPADPGHTCAMLKMQDQLVRMSLTLEAPVGLPDDASESPDEDETLPLPFGESASDEEVPEGGELDNAAGPADSEQAAEPETVVADAAGDETS